jgi:hypothetical protein
MRISSSKPLSQPQETMLLCSLSAYKDRASRTEDHACVQKMIMNQCRSRSKSGAWAAGSSMCTTCSLPNVTRGKFYKSSGGL